MMASIVRSHVILIALTLTTSAVIAGPTNQSEPTQKPSDIDFTVGDDSMVLDAGTSVGKKNAYLTAGTTYNRDDGLAAWLGWQMRGHARNAPSLFGGLGLAVTYVDADEEGSADKGSGIAVPFTGLIGYSFVDEPNLRPLSLMFTFAAAPRVLSFNDVSNFYSYGMLMSWEVIENGSLLFGYRNIKTDLEDRGDVTLTSGLHLGMSFRFY